MDNSTVSGKVVKLLVDNPSDFGFHAAYLAYLKTWDENPDEGTRAELNKILLALVENKGDYSVFYDELNQFRKIVPNSYSNRDMFKAQKKSAWRKSEAKRERISRHKK